MPAETEQSCLLLHKQGYPVLRKQTVQQQMYYVVCSTSATSQNKQFSQSRVSELRAQRNIPTELHLV